MDAPFEPGIDRLRPFSSSTEPRPWSLPGLDEPDSQPSSPTETAPPQPPALRFDEAELARAMAAAALACRRALEQAWQAEEQRRLSCEMAQVRARLEAMADTVATARAETRRALADILATAIRRLVPTLLTRLELDHLRRLLGAWSQRLLPEETVRVRVRPAVREALAAALGSGPEEGRARLEIVADPAMPVGGVTVERAEGAIHHRPEQLAEELVAGLLRLLEASAASPRDQHGSDAS